MAFNKDDNNSKRRSNERSFFSSIKNRVSKRKNSKRDNEEYKDSDEFNVNEETKSYEKFNIENENYIDEEKSYNNEVSDEFKDREYYEEELDRELEEDLEDDLEENYIYNSSKEKDKNEKRFNDEELIEGSLYGSEGDEQRVRGNSSNLTLEEKFKLSYKESKNKMNKSLKIVRVAITLFFVAIMTYMVYFQFFLAPELKTDAGNRRMVEKRKKVIRGAFLDRNNHVITESVLNSEGDQVRQYHGGEAYGPVLGYVSDVYSVTGLESAMDGELSSDTSIKSFLNLEVLMEMFSGRDNLLNVNKTKGHDVITTLDGDLQQYAYDLLGGRKGAVVAVVPSTGEILVMASSPGFNPENIDAIMEKVNTDTEYAAQGFLLNRAIQGVYAPGSTFKVVTLASALQNIKDVEDKTFDDKGYIKFEDGSILPNLNEHAYGELTLQEGLAYSSNVVFGELALDLGNGKLKSTAEGFGFNKNLSGPGYNSEVSKFPSHSSNEKGLIAQSGIGQGEVTATPLQMALVAAGIANNGVIMKPKIVDKVVDVNNVIIADYKDEVLYKALDETTAQKVKDFMAGNRLSGTYSALSSIDGAGKTGTAEFMTSSGLRINSWFIGYAPANNPQIAIAVVLEDLDNTDENLSARNTLPIAAQIMERFLH